MKLATKFGVILGLLGLTVVISLGAALLFGKLLDRELSDPLVATTSLQRDLSRLKREVGAQADRLFGLSGQPGRYTADAAILPPPADAPVNAAINSFTSQLLQNQHFESRIGSTVGRNIQSKVVEAGELIEAWMNAGNAAAGTQNPPDQEAIQALARAASAKHLQIHELIEKIEQRVIDDAEKQIEQGRTLRRFFYTIVAAAMTSAVLLAVLGTLLVRRWVVQPVSQLRIATESIARGDFGHRVPVVSKDELGLLSGEVNHMAGMIDGMQKEAVERERLAAVGEMVRRLAHNLRNPLSGIRGLAELTRMRAPDDDAIRNDQSEIISAVDRFNGWLTDLLQATSPLTIHPLEVETEPWLKGIIESHRPLIRMRSVDLQTDIDSAPKSACFDAKHLEHAIVAILTNAIQASPPGGRVRFTALGPNRSENPPSWEIRITDEGPGISPEIREKIFKPYFTTKRDGNGIGLAVAQSIVKGHGGRIDVRSTPGHGAEFIVRIPIGGNGGNQPAGNSHAAESNQDGPHLGQHPRH